MRGGFGSEQPNKSDFWRVLQSQFGNQSLAIAWPDHLPNLTFGEQFKQSFEPTCLPNSLQSLTLGGQFNQSVDHVTWPRNLQHLTFDLNLATCIAKPDVRLRI